MSQNHERAFLDALESIGVQPAPPLPEVMKEVVAEAPSAVTARNIWHHPDAHPVALALALVRRYGPEWLLWEPETLQVRIPEDFKTSALSDLNLSKLQSCRTLQLVDSYWQRWEVFLACTMPFNNEFPDFEVMQVPTAAQCLVSVDIANRIRADVEWTEVVKVFIATVYRHDGIFLPLPPTDFVSVEVPETVDAQALAARWPGVRTSGSVPKEETVLNEQLRRLLAANTFLEESRSRLQQQLRLNV